MRRWLPGLPVIALLAVAGCSQSSGSTAGDSPNGFPPSIYPRPASFPHWGSSDGCASLKNVAAVPRHARHASLRVLSQWGGISKSRDLHLSDKAEWPTVRDNWARRSTHRHPVHLNGKDVVQGRAKRSPYAGLVRHNCGAPILHRSWWVAVCPGPYPNKPRCTLRSEPALVEHFMLLKRRGHWLVWFSYP
jgi:hypothetical protein